jgi:hypothetical protein
MRVRARATKKGLTDEDLLRAYITGEKNHVEVETQAPWLLHVAFGHPTWPSGKLLRELWQELGPDELQDYEPGEELPDYLADLVNHLGWPTPEGEAP